MSSTKVVGAVGLGEVSAAEDFDEFYRAHFAGTVAIAYGLTADAAEAHDIAQEAFCRAWQRWATVSAYENPVSWVRRVATNLAHSRWRHLKVVSRHLQRQRVQNAPELSPDHVAVVAALRELPANQRKALVLHYLVDLPVAQVASELEVPVGTVKAWLHRGRAALSAELGDEIRRTVTPPPAGEVRHRGAKRQLTRTAAVTTAAVLALVFAVLAGSHWLRREPGPAPAGTPTPTTSQADDMYRVDWTNITIDISGNFNCPQGPLKFTEVGGSSSAGETSRGAGFRPDEVEIGDLTGDGKAEAAIALTCSTIDEQVTRILVVTHGSDGDLHTLGWAPPDSTLYLNWGVGAVWIRDGILYADTGAAFATWLGRAEAFRWTGSEFEDANGGIYQPIVPTTPERRIDLASVAGELPCGELPSRTTADLTFDGQAEADDGDRIWSLFPFPAGEGVPSHWEPLDRQDRPDRPYLLVTVGCAAASQTERQWTKALVLLDQVPGGMRAVAAIVPEATNFRVLQVEGADIFIDDGSGETKDETYHWDGRAFVRQ